MIRAPLALLLALIAGAAARLPAAPLEADLGQGLRLYRLATLPADLPPRVEGARQPPCVVDVRYLPTDEAGALAFTAWLRFRATPRSPVFVLANRETSPALRQALRGIGGRGGIVVIGIAAGDFVPDVPVPAKPEDERRAFDALAGGTPVATLLAENPNKVRNDEASLTRSSPPPPADEPDAVDSGAVKSPPDAALQRAVHLHRTLAALRKL
jgi:hypothetical protein